MTDTKMKEIRKKGRKWIRNHVIVGEILTFILAGIIYEAFGGAKDFSAGGAIAAAVIMGVVAGIASVLIAGPLVLHFRDIKLFAIPDMMDGSPRFFKNEDEFYGIKQDQNEGGDFYGTLFSRRQKVTRGDIMKAYIPHIVLSIISLAVIIVAWILIKRSGSVTHLEGKKIVYDEDIISIHENWGVGLAMGMCALLICVILILRRFVFLTKKSCSGCRALGSQKLEEILSAENGEYERSYTVEDKYRIGSVTVRDNYGNENEQDIIASVPRHVTDRYSTYTATYRCRCIYCDREKILYYYSSHKKN